MRRSILSLVPVFALIACGDDVPNEFTTASGADSSGTAAATDTGAPLDLPDEDGTADNGEGDGDGDSGDGDGDTGDGDGDTGDGDGDTGAPACGNGVVDIGEQCDGSDLNGFSCTDLGYDSGELACDPVTCTYDASACETGGDGDSSGGTSG